MRSPSELTVRTHHVANGNGWELELRQCFHPQRLRRALRPLMIVPGYGMNNFIFSYHPNGLSMEATLAGEGHDVWSVNLRGQGGSRRRGGARVYKIQQIACEDLPVAVDYVIANTAAEDASCVDAIGASLGGTFLYAYLGLVSEPKLGSIVAMGAPLRWEAINPILKLAFSVPELLGRIPMRGTQWLARALFPVVIRFPFLLDVYLHPELVDVTALGELTRTVEDPNPSLNRQLGYWIRHKDLKLNGVNLTTALAAHKNPILCVVANGDGIVPAETALSGLRALSSEVKDVMEVGDENQAYAHADLFICNGADEKVFLPLARWLQAQTVV